MNFKTFFPYFLGIILCTQNNIQAHFGSKGPFGGTASTMIYQGNTVYIGTEEGGVYESTDSNANVWRARPVGLKSGKITALAHSGSYLFAGTADSGIFVFTGYSGTDRYWEKRNNGLENLNILSLTAIDSITLMAGVSGEPGIYLSKDKGMNWLPANGKGMHHFEITKLKKIGSRIIHSALDGGLWASNDFGNTWYDFNDDNTLHIDGTTTFSYNEMTDEILLVNTLGLYKAKVGTGNDPVFSLVTNNLPYNIEIRDIANDGNKWYLATSNGIFYSETNTISWVSYNNGLRPNAHSVTPFKNKLLAGIYLEGIFSAGKPSSSTGWTASNTNFNNLPTFAGTTTGTDIAVVATAKGVFVSKNVTASVATYNPANNGLIDSLHVTDLSFINNNLIATTRNEGVFFSTDTGKTWLTQNKGLTSLNVKNIYSAFGNIYIVDASGVPFQYSFDLGKWISIKFNLLDKVTSIVSFGTKLVVGTSSKGVFIKDLVSNIWAASNQGLEDLNISATILHKDKLFIGTAGAGVWVSDTTYDSIKWSAASKIQIPHITLIGLDPNDIQAMGSNGDFVFASYKGGVVASYDNGFQWQQAGAQFNLPTFTNVRKISFLEAKGNVAGRIFVTTDNNLLYSNSLSELKTDINAYQDPELNNSISIFPNPNNGIFKITGNNVSLLSVYIWDQQGTLISKQSQLNTHFLKIELPTGFYMAQIFSTKGSITKKISVE